jgi:hypothetical protein
MVQSWAFLLGHLTICLIFKLMPQNSPEHKTTFGLLLLAYQGFVTIVCSYADFVDLQKLNLGSPS